MKKILVITKASSEIGLGHIKRCLHLASAIKKENIEVIFGGPEDDLVASLSKEAGFTFQSLKKGINKKISFKENQFKKYDLVLFDLLEEDLNEFCFEEQNVKTAFIYTFKPQKIFGEPNIIFQPGITELNCKEVQLNNKSTNLYSGPNYIILDQYFAERKRKPKSYQGIKNILITMGGSDPSNLTNKLLECFQQIEMKFNLHIVAGHGYKNIETLEYLASKSAHACKIYYSLPSLIPLMRKVDLAFAPGGTTRFELCALGIPFVLLAFNKKQEMNNVLFVKNYNVGFNLGLGEQVTAKKILGVLKKISCNDSLVKDMSVMGQKVVDGKGLIRSKNIILKQIGS